MARRCTVCSHPDRPAIDQMLVNLRPFRTIAQQFKVSPWAVLRHHDDHLPATLVKAQEQEDVRQAIDHIAQLKAINGATLAILKDARAQGNADMALKAIDRLRRQIELQAKLIGELDDRPQVNLLVAPQWLELRVQILTALQPYPEARLAIAEALSGHAG